MKKFVTFAGIQTMPSEAAKMPNTDSAINAVKQNSECASIQSDNVEIPDRFKIYMKNCEKAIIKALKKAAKKASKKAVKKAIKKDEEKRKEEDTDSKKTNTNTAVETIKSFFNKIGDVIVKALPKVLVVVAGIAAKSFFGRTSWFSNKRKGAAT